VSAARLLLACAIATALALGVGSDNVGGDKPSAFATASADRRSLGGGWLGLSTLTRAQGPVVHSTASGEWPTYGGDLASTKYSPLDQITGSNFGSRKIAWRAKSPDGFLSLTLPDGSEWSADSKAIFDEWNRLDPKRWRDGQPPFVANFKATPLMAGGVLYLNTPASVGAAFNARTGALKWVYNPKSYEASTTTMSLRWNQRGVAYWTDGSEERIYWGTGDGYLLAVDARTGRPVKGFGENGRVDLMDGLPRARRGERDYLNALTYSVQSPPIVVRDIVITPAAISSLVKTKEQIPGWIRGFDAVAEPESSNARRAAAVQAAVFTDDGNRHEYRRARLGGGDGVGRSHSQSSAIEGAESPSRRWRHHAQRTSPDENPLGLCADDRRQQWRPAPRRVRQGHRRRAGVDGSARQRHRHSDDVSRQREAVHRADGARAGAGRRSGVDRVELAPGD
jgi:hypothetical protein